MNTQESYIAKLHEKHGTKFDYSKFIYTTVDTPTIVICPEHGEFQISPYNHFRSKYGCKKCGEQAAALAKESSLEEFISKARATHGDKYDYSNTIYTSAKDKLTITCPKHGDFTQLASGHLSGYGCKHCASNGKGRVDMTASCTFYYLHLPDVNLYKIGITTRTIEERYRTAFDRDQFTVVLTKAFDTGREAYEYEQSLISAYTQYKYQGENILKTGNTELFTIDILSLEKD